MTVYALYTASERVSITDKTLPIILNSLGEEDQQVCNQAARA